VIPFTVDPGRIVATAELSSLAILLAPPVAAIWAAGEPEPT
jgi:hypothetical protein